MMPRRTHSRHTAPLSLALLLLLMALLSLPAMAQSLFSSRDEFLSPDQAFQLSAVADDEQVLLRWNIADGYYLYHKRLEFKTAEGVLLEPPLPDGVTITDEYFGESAVSYNQLDVSVAPGDTSHLTLTWQGCAENGLCYAPQSADLQLSDMTIVEGGSLGTAATTPQAPSEETSSAATEASTSNNLGDDQALAERLSQASPFWTLTAFFGMGLLLVFTPCVLPMIPILSSLVVGANASAKRGLMLSIAYVLPMAATYAVLGVAAALAGANLQAMLQTPWVLGIFAALFVIFALAMFGLFELQLPGPLRQRLDNLQQRQKGGTLGGAAVMGVLSALLVGPCMTAPLAGALLYISETSDAVLGGSALFALGLGMGAPLLAVGVLGTRLLPKPGAWMTRVKALFGFVLLGMAIYFIERVINDALALGLWGGWLIAVSVALYQAGRSATPSPGQLISRTTGILFGLWGVIMVLGSATGSSNPWQPLSTFHLSSSATPTQQVEQDFMERFAPVTSLNDLQRQVDVASSAGRWTLVDFYADWCVSCKVIEKEVFGDPEVQAALADVSLLRPDVTKNNAADKALMQEFGIIGPPTLLLIGPDGEERRAQRIIGELSAEDFMARLLQAGLSQKAATEISQ
ncbi:protein-disulfide reductase DsbD [Halomonas halocynthiae]|uniref:protein-disulfide reductase DsbD n=1 Tax=Halomonas halocynthiae TaxID=176290 RepID=UPI000428D22C|nr:protein-disulfide reductase DsbD [Halomonas halocynthiae]